MVPQFQRTPATVVLVVVSMANDWYIHKIRNIGAVALAVAHKEFTIEHQMAPSSRLGPGCSKKVIQGLQKQCSHCWKLKPHAAAERLREYKGQASAHKRKEHKRQREDNEIRKQKDDNHKEKLSSSGSTSNGKEKEERQWHGRGARCRVNQSGRRGEGGESAMEVEELMVGQENANGVHIAENNNPGEDKAELERERDQVKQDMELFGQNVILLRTSGRYGTSESRKIAGVQEHIGLLAIGDQDQVRPLQAAVVGRSEE